MNRKVKSITLMFFIFTFLCSCTYDVTSEFSLGNLKKDEIYTLKKDVFLRVYNKSNSLHPENTPHWSPITIKQFQNNSSNDYFIEAIIPIGTKVKFVGVKKTYEPIANQNIYNYQGEILSGKYVTLKVNISDLITKNNVFDSDITKKFFGIR